jgi:ABC-type branched-subunit amino acid transport system ATPase component
MLLELKQVSRAFGGLMVRRIRDSGITIVMVEHLVKASFGISDRVAVLSAGEKLREGKPEIVAQDPRVIDAYLGTDHTEAAEFSPTLTPTPSQTPITLA